MDVRNPGRTIPQATALGILSISGIYLLVAWAMFASSRGQVPGSEQTTVSVAQIITVIFGSYSNFVIMICTSVLCICTYLMIVGGISRLMETLAGDGRLPSFLSLSSKQGVPVSALATLTCFHIADLMLLHSGLITLEQLISLANVFFLANSLIAVASAMRLIPSLKLRVPCIILILGFIALLSFSSFWSLLGLAMVTIYVFKTSRVRHK